MNLYNTLTRQIEQFKPLNSPTVTFYSCGPTVYDFTHIGHLRTYINNDLLKRALSYFGYKVKHVMNITDVGHLTGDDDRGEDKLEKGAKKTGKMVWEVAEFYTDYFNSSVAAVNILPPDHLVKATDHITDVINLISRLEKGGFTYQSDEAVYFDISKWKKYGVLSKQKNQEKIVQARDEVHVDSQKKHPADFSLWFFRKGRFSTHAMHWESPWGEGFPGWHIECSAMSMKYLGETIDIHAGGIDHIPVHHENEIAQSEAATGKPYVHLWFHNNFLLINGEKMSKSLGNIITLEDLVKKNINPLVLRYLFLQAHYRQLQNFTWEAIKAADQAYHHLKELIINIQKQIQRSNQSVKDLNQVKVFKKRFNDALTDDLQIPKALAILWAVVKSDLSPKYKYELIILFDQILGLRVETFKEEMIPRMIIDLAKQRDTARQRDDFKTADKIRQKMLALGYTIEDTPKGHKIRHA